MLDLGGVSFAHPDRYIKQDGQRRDLTPEEYDRYQQTRGQVLYRALEEAIADPDWRTSSPEERRTWVNRIKREVGEDTRDELFSSPLPPFPAGAVATK